MNRPSAFEEITLTATRERIETASYADPDSPPELGRTATYGAATGDIKYLAQLYMTEAPIQLSEIDPRFSGAKAVFLDAPSAIGAMEFCPGSGHRLPHLPKDGWIRSMDQALAVDAAEKELLQVGLACPVCGRLLPYGTNDKRVVRHERRGRPGMPHVLGRSRFLVLGLAVVDGLTLVEGRLQARSGEPIVVEGGTILEAQS